MGKKKKKGQEFPNSSINKKLKKAVWAEIPDFIATESKNRDSVILTVIFVIFLNLRVFNEEKCDKLQQREIWAESLWEKK